MDITRDNLIQHVTFAADRSRIPSRMKEEIVQAVSDPSVKRIAIGLFVNDEAGCMCPASLAGYQAEVFSHGPITEFATHFDFIMDDAGFIGHFYVDVV